MSNYKTMKWLGLVSLEDANNRMIRMHENKCNNLLSKITKLKTQNLKLQKYITTQNKKITKLKMINNDHAAYIKIIESINNDLEANNKTYT